MTATDDDTPRVWIGCLGCYNAGVLAGKWFDAVDCPTDMDEFNTAIGFKSLYPRVEPWETGPDAYRPPLPQDEDEETATNKHVVVSRDHGHPLYGPHEELWVMDHEHFGGFLRGECSPDTAKRIAEWLSEHDDLDLAALGAFASHEGEKLNQLLDDESAMDDFLDTFQARFCGEWNSVSDWAYDYLEGSGFWEGVPEHVSCYESAIVQAWISDNENGGAFYEVNVPGGGYYIFWNG